MWYLCGLNLMLNRLKRISILLLLFLNVKQHLTAQCTSTISSFPYVQSFETDDGGFFSNNAGYWEWGSIVPGTKQVITAAADGQKCWIVGGLSGARYNQGTSYLTSPCFNLTNLVSPELSMSVFWETERLYDGVHVEYSLNQGLSWTLLGSSNSEAQCQGVNWYNNTQVRFLGNRAGWSGSITNGTGSCLSSAGSVTWVNAKHSLTSLAGQPSVAFRLVFGAGNICNDFEGFAMDLFSIREAVAPVADFTTTCSGPLNVIFNSNPLLCQRSVSWDFGDPASGTSNQSTLQSPVHRFSAPGRYTVTETVTFTNNSTSVRTREVILLDIEAVITDSISCWYDNLASIRILVNDSTSAYSYSLDGSTPQISSLFNNITEGTHYVEVTGANVCPGYDTITITKPQPINITSDINNATCQKNNGSIDIQTISGGTPPFRYSWSNGSSNQNITSLTPGAYNLEIRDARNCLLNAGPFTVANQVVPANPRLGRDTVICNGANLILSPGAFSSYVWQDLSTGSTLTVTQAGSYFVEVENAAGCKGRDSITISDDCSEINFPAAFTPDGNGRNETFGALGSTLLISSYSLRVYNRYGQPVFSTTQPSKKWDGKQNGKPADSGVYVWIAQYLDKQLRLIQRKGTVILLR
ncbi:MAG: hypothetical protein RIR96_103 [Bacteroidota bacterium]